MQIERLVTHADARPALTFSWGGIKWLCNRATDPEAKQTLGLVFINPGAHNPLHYHPNCEELLHVLSGTCDHRLGDEVVRLNPGDTIRIPTGVPHNATSTGWEPLRLLVSFSSADRQTVTLEEG